MSEGTVAAPASTTPAAGTPNANNTPAVTTEVQATTPRVFKVKVDGNDMDIDEATLVRDYQTSQSSNKRFQEASQTRAQAEEVLKLFKENPKKAFEKLGINAKDFAEMVLNEHMENEMLSPEQRQLRDYKAQLDQIAADNKKTEDGKQQEEATRLEAHYLADWDRQFTDVLGTAGLPKNANTVRSMAYYMKVALDNGFNDITPAQVVSYVRADYQNSIKELFGSADENTLLSFLGEDMVKKIVKGDLNKHKIVPKVPPVAQKSNRVNEPGKPVVMSPSEYFKKQRKERQV
jgi:antitoxin component of RelBE/YafQ-DinJ toxin-antitoxin module